MPLYVSKMPKVIHLLLLYYLFSSYLYFIPSLHLLLHPSSSRPNSSTFSTTSSPSAFDHLSLLSPSPLPPPPSQGWVSVRMIYYPAPFSPFLSHWITEHSQRRQLHSLAFHTSYHRHWLVHGTRPAKDTQWQWEACKVPSAFVRHDSEGAGKRAAMQTSMKMHWHKQTTCFRDGRESPAAQWDTRTRTDVRKKKIFIH